MSIHLNDKVKFLDEEGGGIVTKIIDHAVVEVTTVDGFSFPYQVKDLVVISSETINDRLFSKEMEMPEIHSVKNLSQPAKAETSQTSLHFKTHGYKKELFAFYLAFVPREQYRLVFGSIDLFMVNVSDKQISYALYLRDDNSFIIRDKDTILPFSRKHLGTIEREELNAWENVVIQMFLVEEKASELRGPIDNSLKIRGNRFFSENSYIKSDFLSEKALLVQLARMESIPILHSVEKQVTEGVEDKIVRHEAVQKSNKIIFEHQTEPKQAIVDMHIWKLTDDELSLSAHDKLLLQLDYFKKCLESAIEHKFEQIVFIHGVGTGRLRDEICILLDDRQIEYKPAPISEYGIGALVVKLRKNQSF
ncbi:MAG: DUF2027 domain-containing protein [Bacteroidales bacterium]|nr:DUF2027 domain-containing protein [Bacteroidales bacterium]